MLKLPTATLCAAALLATAAEAVPFDIVVDFQGGLSASQQGVFVLAESLWESLIPAYADGVEAGPLVIAASAPDIDGPGGVLGQAGPTDIAISGGFVLATAGIMQFDSADLDALEADETLGEVVFHEMAHVMGFGTLWSVNDVYDNRSGRYTGAAGVAAYQAEFGATDDFVPVDTVSGIGTRDLHWDEDWLGGRSEIMTGFLDSPATLSQTTVSSFDDIGFRSSTIAAIPLPAGLPLGLGALAMLCAAGRRRPA